MPEWLNTYEWLGNTLFSWAVALVIFLGFFCLFILLRRVVATRLKAVAEKTETRIDDILFDIIGNTKTLFLLLVALALSCYYLTLPAKVTSAIRPIIVISLFIQAGIWANRLVTYWLNNYVKRRLAQDTSASAVLMASVFVGRLVVWSIVVLLTLDNLGVQVTALLAGLGVGGIAVALAVQNVLQDLFASLSIVLDKPFMVGDTIVVGDDTGEVEHIGLKTTRLRSLTGEQLIFSNATLLNGRIKNYKRMSERRLLFEIGVVYETTHAKLALIPGIVREIVEKNDRARFDRCYFKTFGDFALIYEVGYFVKSPDFYVSIDVRQEINLEIARRFGEEGIAFAYPTHMVYTAPFSRASST